MVNVRGGLAIRCPFGEGADQLLRRTFHPAHLALEVCQALYKEQRSDRRAVKVIEEDCLVKAQAFQSRFVEKQRRSLRHAFILQSAARRACRCSGCLRRCRANCGFQMAGAAFVRWRPLPFYRKIEVGSNRGTTAIVGI